MDEAAIECHQVIKIYKQAGWGKDKRVEALRGISLSVSYGDIVGLIGPNGAGKTTLMNLITGVAHPTSGRIAVGGCAAGSKGAKRLLGYMPESPAFLETYSVEAELHYHGALCHLKKKSRTKRIEELLDQLGLRSMRSRRCGRLSHGMRQRLALAIALIMKPRILILDEPGNGLDPVGVVQLREIVTSLSRAGTAILISSHRLQELEKVTSTFIGIWDGQVVDLDMCDEEGGIEEVFLRVSRQKGAHS